MIISHDFACPEMHIEINPYQGDDYDSHTLKSLMHHNPSKEYSLMYEECCKEYLTPLAAMEKEA